MLKKFSYILFLGVFVWASCSAKTIKVSYKNNSNRPIHSILDHTKRDYTYENADSIIYKYDQIRPGVTKSYQLPVKKFEKFFALNDIVPSLYKFRKVTAHIRIGVFATTKKGLMRNYTKKIVLDDDKIVELKIVFCGLDSNCTPIIEHHYITK